MISQNQRLGVFYPPDNPDTGQTESLALMRFSGQEGVNRLYEFEVECLSTSANIDFDRLLGRNASVALQTLDPGHPDRHFDGLLTEARWLGLQEGGHGYVVTLRPWLWLLGLRQNQRIFHRKTAPDILAEIFADHGFSHVADLQRDYPEMEYTVQFQETDLEFTERLMSMFGINYYFRHDKHAHELVLFDEIDSLPEIPGGARPYRMTERQFRDGREHLHDWVSGRRMSTGRVAMTDYNFTTPRAAMLTEKSAGAKYEKGDIESFVYPGRYPDQGKGNTLTELRQNQAAMGDGLHSSHGDCAGLMAGMRITVTGHPDPGVDGRSFVALSCAHSFTAEAYRSGGIGGAEEDSYRGWYELRAAETPVVPPPARVAPRVPGPQTAVVVGEGEIDCDKYGRILVRFHWDREGARSMRCRVAQLWAGKGWGGLAVPRIGMEVVVEFIDGDPARPLVVGCVYNADNMPPFEVAEGGKTMGMKSNSTPGGGGYNELAFDDTKGKEEVRLHAQYDLNAKVLHDETREVDNDRTTKIGKNDTLDVGKELTVTAGTKITLKVGASTITMDASSITLQSPTIEVKAAQTFKSGAGMTSEHKAGALMDIKGALVKINS
jgi:type VI secretion system secreted protein VgrG